MDVSVGIVGLPNTGKSTLFNALTKKSVPAENFPFCTIDPSVGIVSVPDTRLEKLSVLSYSARTVPATVAFTDIAGLVRGASEGEGLGNTFLSHIREVSVIAHMVRCFPDDSVIHVDGSVDPMRDIGTVETELLLADLQTVERRLKKTEKDAKSGDSDAVLEQRVLSRIHDFLKQGEPISSVPLDREEKKHLKGFGLLSMKPVLYICNVSEKHGEERVSQVREHAGKTGNEVVVVSVRTEQELSGFAPEDARTMREEMGTAGDGIDSIIQAAYRTLGCISFFTTGEKETRAWTVLKDSSAPEAAGVIHSDFEKTFIRAEVIAWEDLVKVGSYADARAAGFLRLEGKEYTVRDGDVIIFRTGA